MGVLRTILLALFTISFGALVAFGWDVSKGLVSAKTRGGIIPGIRASKTPLVILVPLTVCLFAGWILADTAYEQQRDAALVRDTANAINAANDGQTEAIIKAIQQMGE
jgi:hypothetical protein